MIEKIKEHDVIDPKTGNVIGKIGCDLREIMDKLNEVIDAANELQTQVSILEEHAHPTAKTPDYDDTDDIAEVKNENLYAEQRKWIGCLVEYGNADDGFRYGILTNVEPRYSAYPFEIDNGRDATADCWLPSKTIFYKGDDNE